MAYGYFVVPRVGDGTEEDPYRAKYLYTAPPNPHLRPEVDASYGSEEMERPIGSGNYYMAVRVFADEADLTTLEGQPDTYRVEPADVINALNGAGIFPVNLSAKEWSMILSHFLKRPIEDTEPA